MASVLADTNLWLRAADENSAQHSVALNALARLPADGHELCITPQVIMEFWAVATRPETANGLGWTAQSILASIKQMRSRCSWLADDSRIFHHWLSLVTAYEVQGKRTHDARIASVMETYSVPYLLTFNGADFAAFPKVNVIEPAKVTEGLMVL